MGSVTPLVFGTNGGVGADCNCFLNRLAEKLSEENEEPYLITITWIRTLLYFEILRSVHTCVRGSRSDHSTQFHKGDFIDDCRLNATQACVIMAWARKLVKLNWTVLYSLFRERTRNNLSMSDYACNLICSCCLGKFFLLLNVSLIFLYSKAGVFSLNSR